MKAYRAGYALCCSSKRRHEGHLSGSFPNQQTCRFSETLHRALRTLSYLSLYPPERCGCGGGENLTRVETSRFRPLPPRGNSRFPDPLPCSNLSPFCKTRHPLDDGFCECGGGEIRTLGGLPHTRFPSVRTRPLCDASVLSYISHLKPPCPFRSSVDRSLLETKTQPLWESKEVQI